MTVRRQLKRVLAVIAVVVIGSLVVGMALGQPVFLSYAESGSMEPTIDEGDGFVTIPAAISSDVETGDVVVFEAQEIDDGGLTTHRVVGETDAGYVTRGDANVVTDQDGGEPPVTDGQVVATVVQIDGTVLTIPHLGTAVEGVRGGVDATQIRLASLLGTSVLLGSGGLSLLLLVIGLGSLALVVLGDRRSAITRIRSRSRSRPGQFDARRVVLGLCLLIAAVTVLTIVAMSATVETGVVSAEQDSDAPGVIEAGDSENRTFELRNDGFLPIVTAIEPASDGIAVDEEATTLHRGESINTTASVTAPPETGYYVRSFAEHRYFAVLPPPVIAELHAIHPWVATAGVAGTVAAVVTLPFALLYGTGRIRTRPGRRRGRNRRRGGRS